MRVTPMSRIAMLLGRSLRDAVLLLMQAAIMIVIAIPFGITIDPAGLVVTLALVGLIGLAMAPLSYSAALVLKSEDAFAPVVQFIALPLLLLSGIFLPLQLAPQWLQTLSDLNPVTYAVDAVRAAFNGMWGDPSIVTGSTIVVVIAIVAVWTASRAFSRATS
jgi:ABC-2 type transport system permease protein